MQPVGKLPQRGAFLTEHPQGGDSVGHEHRRTQPLARDIADNQAHPAIIQLGDIVEVAGHLVTRDLARADLIARNLGLGLADRVAPLKQLFARSAQGTALGDLPSLAKPAAH